jgi:hypothetical protein
MENGKIQEVKPSRVINFLKLVESQWLVSALLAGCSKDNDADSSNKLPGLKNGVFDLGSGDFRFTYAYALEQLVILYQSCKCIRFNTNFTAEDKLVLIDLYNHGHSQSFLKLH